MVERIQEMVTELPYLENVSDVCASVDHHVARGDAEFAAELSLALAKACGSDAGCTWQFRNVFDHVLRLPATTPGTGHVGHALRLVSSPEVADWKLEPYAASVLASSHPVEGLTVAFTGYASEKLWACLVQELVLRGVDVAQTPGSAAWVTSPHWRRHPLRRLPLGPSQVEERPALPNYDPRNMSYSSLPYGPSADHGPAVVTKGRPVPSARETTTEPEATAMTSAVANWAEESNGRTEVRVFTLTGPMAGESVPAALPTLG